MINKLCTHLNFTILMSDGFFFLPDLLLQNEFLSVGVKGIKWVDDDDEDDEHDFITEANKKENHKKWSFQQCVKPEANQQRFSWRFLH